MVTTRSAGASEPLEMLQTPPRKPRKTRVPKNSIAQTRVSREASLDAQVSTPISTASTPVSELPPCPVSCCWFLSHSPTVQNFSPTLSLLIPSQDSDVSPSPRENITLISDQDHQSVILAAPEHSKDTEDIAIMEANKVETPETSPPTTSTSKRRRSEDETQDVNTELKRARTDTSNPPRLRQPSEETDMLFMFPKRHRDDEVEEGDDLSRSAPPKSVSYADIIRHDRKMRNSRRSKNNPFGFARRGPLAKVHGQNPFGIETFTAEEIRESQPDEFDPSCPKERHDRDERSAAPEPETPRPQSLFGSLRNLGSATLGRAQTLFGSLTPRSTSDTPEPASRPAYQARTEPRKRQSKPVWEIDYPQLPKTPVTIEEEETESEKKRKSFEAEWGETNRDYDHLHTESIDGNPENLPYPIKKPKPPQPDPYNEDHLDPSIRTFRQDRKKANLKKYGIPRPKILPQRAPLFGPNSHYARRTVDPTVKELLKTGRLPIDNVHNLDRKRKAVEPPQHASSETSTFEPAKSRTFQPYMEDEDDNEHTSEDVPATPLAKKQKTTHHIPQTPRSALKAPGSVGRAGRSVMFNADPVASIKRMTPPAPAGTYDPTSPFQTLSDIVRNGGDSIAGDSPSSVSSMDPSPNTRANTMFNSITHPGDALTSAINTANPEKTDYVWRDPTNPIWRPSLANPKPGTYRLVLEDDEEEEEALLADIERMETDKESARKSDTSEPEAPQPPSTPRMSHAELPKQAGTAQNTSSQSSAASNASALEAANLERRRAEATKTKPKTSSRLAEVTSARSRSPSPPGLDTDVTDAESSSPTDSAAKTPSPLLEQGTWTWTDDTNEFISSNPSIPDFAYNSQGELIPAFALKSTNGSWDDRIRGPDQMTEYERQNRYAYKYNDEWARQEFKFDDYITYEEAGCGSKYIHDLIRTNDARHPEVVDRCDRRFAEEWDAHAQAIEDAQKQGKRLVATFPDRDGVDMLDADEEL